MSDWQTDSEGNVVLHPMVGWKTAQAAKSACVLRAVFARDDAQLRSSTPDAIQFVMTPAQALQLAEDLVTLANHILKLPSAKGRSN